MKNTKGFSIIEFIIAIIVLGIVAVAIVRQYSIFSVNEVDATKIGIHGYLQASLATYLARNKNQDPNVTQLAASIHEPIHINQGSLSASSNGKTFVFPTYSDEACTIANTTDRDLVKCIGNGITE